ncbi:TetR/AcrR family transcriptional regulator [Hydrogenophaga sp. 5NK40-0174]|uniref:TetR/AcrR family transcriptional regulator n=1 Tax=Hydrogenophaga sp. 5NK40-0174 TaxID=3127649 RepID=UPI003342D4AE
MGRNRSANYEDQREAILAQAAALFASQGYPGTSMNQVAAASGLSKPTLYHYFKDKYALLVHIAEGHVKVLEQVVMEVEAMKLKPDAALREMIERFVMEYAGAADAHRVLTEDVRFLQEPDRQRILGHERKVVEGFADAIALLRPELDKAHLTKPLTMLLFGMINWMFTWVRADGHVTHEQLAPMVADLFFGGLPAVGLPAIKRKR